MSSNILLVRIYPIDHPLIEIVIVLIKLQIFNLRELISISSQSLVQQLRPFVIIRFCILRICLCLGTIGIHGQCI